MRRLMLCLLCAVVVVLMAQAAFAASEITVTVTLGQLGVDVTPTSWALGVVAPSGVKSSWASGSAGYFTATNTGNTEADFVISATNTTPSGWVASAGSGVDAFIIAVGVSSPPHDTEPGYGTGLGASPTTLAENIAAAGTFAFDLELTAPALGSTYNAGGETFTVVLGATTL